MISISQVMNEALIDLAEIPPSLVHPNGYSLNHCSAVQTAVVSESLIQVERTGSESQKFSPILPWLKPTLLLGGISPLFPTLWETKAR